MKTKKITKTNARVTPMGKVVPGKLSVCGYCDPNNNYCNKYGRDRNWIGEYTWQNFCMQSGGCDN